jgi:hypothetical protein
MIPLLLMLAAAADAPAMTPVDAERAFAAAAKTIGQWTAFRKWSTDDAVMFVPQPVNAHEFLKDRKDPPRVIDWWPTASWISCDGKTAVNTGGWQRPDGAVGYFTTIWQRQPDGGWKWTLDSGDSLTVPRPAGEPTVSRAACNVPKVTWAADPPGAKTGRAADNSLNWIWSVKPDGGRDISVVMWTGKGFKPVLENEIVGTPANK